MTGNLDDNSLAVLADGEIVAMVQGTRRSDVLLATASSVEATVSAPAQVINAGTGDTTVTLGKFDDTVVSLGNAVIDTGGGDDTVYLFGEGEVSTGEGTDTIRLSPWFLPAPPQPTGPRRVDAGPGDDTIIGSPLADQLVGGPGDDIINSDAGPDDVDGGAGFDRCDSGPIHRPSPGDRYRSCELSQVLMAQPTAPGLGTLR